MAAKNRPPVLEKPDRVYGLSDAARKLNVDYKTLQKRMERAGITPTVSDEDHRLRLLTEEQIQRLGSMAMASHGNETSAIDTSLGEIVKMLRVLTRRVRKIEEHLESHQQLRQEVTWRGDEWERTTGALLRLMNTIERDAGSEAARLSTGLDLNSSVDAKRAASLLLEAAAVLGATERGGIATHSEKDTSGDDSGK